MSVREVYSQLGPRIRTLATVLHEDAQVSQVSMQVGVSDGGGAMSCQVSLSRDGRARRLVVRDSRGMTLYRGRLSDFYGVAERAAA